MSSDSSSLPMYVYIILIFTLMIINALSKASKRALDYIDRSVIEDLLDDEPDNTKLQTVMQFIQKPSKYHYADHCLAIIIILAIFCLFNSALKPLMSVLPLCLVNILFFILYTALFDFFPKKLAAQSSEKTAVKLVRLQKAIYVLMLPLSKISTGLANIFLLIFGKETDVDDAHFSEGRVMYMLEKGQEKGEIKEDGRKMIDSIFEFDDLLAYEIMTPRTDVFMIDINDSKDEYFDEMMEMRHSRIPVYDDDVDNIIGILHIKDYLLSASKVGFDNVDIRSLVRPVYFVPDSKNIDSLFHELQRQKHHLAVLIDEYGGFSGIVSIEDIIEQIVGDIDDEFDEVDRVIIKENDKTFVVDGNVYLDDLNEETGIELESDNSETVGGFIIDLMGEIPKDNVEANTISFENYEFTILQVKDRRIEKARIVIKDDDAEVNEALDN